LRRLFLPGEEWVRHSSSLGPKDSLIFFSTMMQTGPADEWGKHKDVTCETRLTPGRGTLNSATARRGLILETTGRRDWSFVLSAGGRATVPTRQRIPGRPQTCFPLEVQVQTSEKGGQT
jgi:hypothetical protein